MIWNDFLDSIRNEPEPEAKASKRTMQDGIDCDTDDLCVMPIRLIDISRRKIRIVFKIDLSQSLRSRVSDGQRHGTECILPGPTHRIMVLSQTKRTTIDPRWRLQSPYPSIVCKQRHFIRYQARFNGPYISICTKQPRSLLLIMIWRRGVLSVTQRVWLSGRLSMIGY